MKREAQLLKIMTYILDFTGGESFEYSEDKVNELLAFGHYFEVARITSKGEEILKTFNKTEH